MGWLENSTAVITGAADGIGRAVALRYLEEGAKGVVVLDRDLEPLSAALEAHPNRLIAVQGDVREYQDHVKAIDLAVKNFGALDVLVGNAGVYDFRRPLRSYSAETMSETLDEIFAINLRGNLFAAMAAREALIASKGSMIFTTSVAGIHAGGGGVVYTASKHAIVGMIRQLAAELAPDVRVNGVGPGGTLTSLRGSEALGQETRSMADARDEVAKRIGDAVPLRFAQDPEDHAGLYVLLASKRNSRAITGEVLMSDGGIGIRPL
ncbi:MAG: SDR family NAD(P)-dependent oxidoreductase [Marinosulfonomonas sp.]|nr:SDR family NAD(P)-dependent oxidoreductase [Marinosulfonomonas sp.]